MSQKRLPTTYWLYEKSTTMKISIITVSYNSAETLRDTIESVLHQTHKDIDYIVIDGASSDGSIELLREYEPKFDGRMRWVSEPDKGLYDAMNKGIAMAKGDAIGFLNSDDFYTSERSVEIIANQLEKTNVDAVYGEIHFVRASDLTKTVRYYSSRLFHRRWIRFGFIPAHPSFYCRREIYEKLGGFDTQYHIAADFDCFVRFMFLNNITTCYIPMDFVTMRTGGASTSGMASHMNIMSEHVRILKSHGIYSNAFILSLRYFYKIFEKYFGVMLLSHKNTPDYSQNPA